ncbi:MAG: thiazole synthase [Proteobacteria bacterium]|nr:thiazole synthase [Pseudomonadota bacterium]
MLKLGDHSFKSRLIVGTGRYSSFEQMQACHEASGTEMVTVAVRRVDLAAAEGQSILDFIDSERIKLLPNTSGCYTPEDAVMTAQLAREAFGTDLIKVEVIGCDRTLFPDSEGTLEACRQLVADGFTVLPYCMDDPVLCQRLEDLGCAAVMPLAAPIGSGLGLRNPTNLRIIRELVEIPVIVDAGIGTPSDATAAMELGADAVLLNTAIAGAGDPVSMASAFKLAVEAGKLAHDSGRMPMKLYATASSPLDGRFV